MDYCIRAVTQTGNRPNRLTNGATVCTSIASGNVEYYGFTVSANACRVDFNTFGANGNVDLCIQRGPPAPTTYPTNWNFCSRNGGSVNESISLNPNSMPR